MACSLARRRGAAELLLRAVGLAVVAFVAVVQLPSSFLRGLRQPSHLLRPSAPTRQPSVQRYFFQFPDWEAEERERQRKLKEKQEAEAAAKRRDTLTKGGIAVLGLAVVSSVLGSKEDTPAVKSTTPATPAPTAKGGAKITATSPAPPPTKAPQAIVDPKTSKRVQEAQRTLKKAEDARTKAAEERKKRQAVKKQEDDEAAKKKADAAKQKDAAKKAKDADVKKKKDELEKSKKETDERIRKAKEEAAKTNPGGPQWGTILPLTAIAGAGVYFVGPKMKKEESPKKDTISPNDAIAAAAAEAAAEAKPAAEAAEKAPAAAAAAEKPAAAADKAAAEKPAAEKPAAAEQK